MNRRDLHRHPAWREADLGAPLPDSTHAVSFALPLWEHVVGYEERAPEIMTRLHSGYPRFVIHPLVRELARTIAPADPSLPFPSESAARRCADYIRAATGLDARLAPDPRAVWCVTAPDPARRALHEFWQHSGLIVSSRQAEALLDGRRDSPDAPAIRQSLRDQLAAFYGCSPSDVFLQPSGMAAHLAALAALAALAPGRPTVQIGFPYVDTLKLQQRLGHGAILIDDLDRAEDLLSQTIDRTPVAGCFSEIPGNPLLGCADLHALAPLLRRRGVPLVADDVVATPFNVDLTPHADLIATSLTKFFVGTGDAIGGALICNPRSPLHASLRRAVETRHEELLWGDEAAAIERELRDFPDRMRRHNDNGLAIARKLREHPGVERVWYPRWESAQRYESLRRPGGGWGSLVTFLPRDAATAAPRIYDALEISKGPSLGTSFTLACPFTLLAHYTELDWAESCGVSRHLIRLSIGLEDPDTLWTRIARALDAAHVAAAPGSH